MGAVALTRAVGGRAVAQPARRLADEHLDRRDERRYREDLTRAGDQHRTLIEQHRDSEQHAQERLTERATGLLDARYDDARATIARKPQILDQIKRARADGQRQADGPVADGHRPAGRTGQPKRGGLERASELENELTSAERFVEGAREHERITGQRYTPRQIADARAAVEREFATPPDERDYEQLAYRLPGGRDAYRTASEPEKRGMREQVDQHILHDRDQLRSAQHASDLLQAHRPVTPRPPRPRRPRPYRRHEFHGSRQHMPPQPRERT
jgi:hypothetical protein